MDTHDLRAIATVGCLAALLLSAGACDKLKGGTGPEASATTTPTSIGNTGAAPADALKVGDRVSVRWKGQCYPARILKVAQAGTYFITYEGYDHSWDETITGGANLSLRRRADKRMLRESCILWV